MEYKDGVIFKSDRAIRDWFKNMSLPAILTREIKDSLGLTEIVETENPATDLQSAYQDGVELIDGIPTMKWVVVDKTEEELQVEVTAKTTAILTSYKATIQAMIDSEAQNRGYDDINAIAKYQGYTNMYQEETIALGMWCADCWTKGYIILDEVQKGIRALPTIEEVLAELPMFVFTPTKTI